MASVSGFETLQVHFDGNVAIVTVNRPDKRNALNATVRTELLSTLDFLKEHDPARVIIITGAGDKAFVAGADIAEFAERTPIEQRAVMSERNVFDEIAKHPKPIIAMINGYALGGGCELALACDVRVAGRSAKMGQPEIKLGLIPGGGGTQRLPRLMGMGRALRLVLGGEMISADEAEKYGMVDIVVEDADLLSRTLDLARAMAAQSPLTLRLAKTAVRAAEEMPLTAGLAFERELFITAFGSADKSEGVAAFLDKRTANFRGL